MRTTVNIDPDVLMAVKERARRERRSAGDVLSELARRALTSQGSVAPAGEPVAFFGFEPLPHRGPVVSNDVVDRLREEEGE
jgi:hypothetical protein